VSVWPETLTELAPTLQRGSRSRRSSVSGSTFGRGPLERLDGIPTPERGNENGLSLT